MDPAHEHLPDNATIEGAHEAIDEAESIFGVTRELRIERVDARRIVRALGREGDLPNSTFYPTGGAADG